MKWTICILTVPEREKDLTRITGLLQHQIGSREDVCLLVNAREGSLGEKRQWCVENATGEYMNFVDDDDIIAHDYVDTIYPLLDGVDYIGFRLQMYVNGERQLPTTHSLRYPAWSEDENGFYRNVTHLNPMRREVVEQARFEGGFGEDRRWSEQVKPETEHFIDRPMYFYFYSKEHSLSDKARQKELQHGNPTP